MTSASPARRALIRWAWRMFRAEWRQQLLVLGLVIVAVAASVTMAAIASAGGSRARGEFGTAKAIAHVDLTGSTDARTIVAAARRRFGAIALVGHSTTTVPGSPQPLDLRAQDPRGRFARSTVGLIDGRYPRHVDEVAMTKGVLDLFGAHVGTTLRIGREQRHVVGRVENPAQLNDDFALLAPSQQLEGDRLDILLGTTPGPNNRPSVDGPGFAIEVAPSIDQSTSTGVIVIATLAMGLVGLLAAAGFVVIAQRRQRQLGLLAALGATERNLRLVTLANGAIVGILGAAIGAALGIGGWTLAAPAVETSVNHRLDRFALPWGLVVSMTALAVAMSILAAWWPARTTARVPVTVALSRRPHPAQAVRRSLAALVVLCAASGAALAAARPTSHPRPGLLILGLGTLVVALVLAAPGTIRLTDRPARRLPLASRLALRDLIRYQARASAALAAMALALSIAVAIVVVAQVNEYRPEEGNLSSRQMVVQVATGTPEGVAGSVARTRLDRQVATLAASLGAKPLALQVAMARNLTSGVPREPVALTEPVSQTSFRDTGPVYVATPALYRYLGVDPRAIDPAVDLVTAQRGRLFLLDTSVRADPTSAPTRIQRIEGSQYTDAPRSLITSAGMDRHDWVAVPDGWFVEAGHPISPNEIQEARRQAAAAGLTIEVRSAQDDLAALRQDATIVGVALALAITAMSVGLIRSEGRRDLQTLIATGAPARTRRAVTATTAGALAALGVGLSFAFAYGALVAAYRQHLGELWPAPVTNLLSLAVGLPLLAAGAGWVLAGRASSGSRS